MSRINPGSVIAGYKVESLIGRGGMGEVFKALQVSLNRTVALKVLPGGFGQGRPDKIERFLREARVAAQINHPNVIQIIDAGNEGGVFFIAMEYVMGEDLARLVAKHGPLPGEICRAMAVQAAKGLAAAWEKRLVHRDIKPDNIIVTPGGVVKIADFGLAREAASEARLTRPGAVMGTPAYMSPEQAGGKEVDVRSDIYSLGATVYFCAAGAPPFRGASAYEIVRKVVESRPEPLSACAPGFPERLRPVVETMMAKKPEERYATPADVLAALEDAAPQPGPVPAPAAGAASPARADSNPEFTLDCPEGALQDAQGSFARFAARTVLEAGSPGPAARGRILLSFGPAQDRKVFVFTGRKILFGRRGEIDRDGRPKAMDLVLRALPCRSEALDAENFRRNSLISRFHGWFDVSPGSVSVTDRAESPGISVAGTALEKNKPRILAEGEEIVVGPDSVRMTFRLLGHEDPGDRHAWADPYDVGPCGGSGGALLERRDESGHDYLLLWRSIRLDRILPLDSPAWIALCGGCLHYLEAGFAPPRILEGSGAVQGGRVRFLFRPAAAEDFK